jgi:hypothetical protein
MRAGQFLQPMKGRGGALPARLPAPYQSGPGRRGATALRSASTGVEGPDDPGLRMRWGERSRSAKLRGDIKYLGWALGNVIRKSPDNGEAVFASVEQLRKLAKEWRTTEPTGPGAPAPPDAMAKLQELVDVSSKLPSSDIVLVARCVSVPCKCKVHSVHICGISQRNARGRAFKNFLALSNTAEANHRVRRVKLLERESGSLKEDGFDTYRRQPLNTTMGTIQSLLGRCAVATRCTAARVHFSARVCPLGCTEMALHQVANWAPGNRVQGDAAFGCSGERFPRTCTPLNNTQQ